jgi:hypothetical protein
VGFNCFGCCTEFPTGEVIPVSIAFDIGQVPLFQAAEIDHTCQGDIGPNPVDSPSLSYTTPLSWDGVHVSTSDLTYQTLSFTARDVRVSVTCQEVGTTISGSGPGEVDQCQHDNNPGHDPGKGCNQSPNSGSCSDCYSCCDKQKAVGYCRCDKAGGNVQACKAGVVAACGSCKQLCFGTYDESCTAQVTSCQP